MFIASERRLIGKPGRKSMYVLGKPTVCQPYYLIGSRPPPRFVLGNVSHVSIARLRKFPEHPTYGEIGVYVLQLQKDYFYVGKSFNIEERIKQHMQHDMFEGDYKGAYCARNIIRRVNPLTVSIPNDLEAWERAETLERMYEHGIHKVRGWMFTLPVLTRDMWDSAFRQICERFDLCRKCGAKGHFIQSCAAKDRIRQFQFKWDSRRKDPKTFKKKPVPYKVAKRLISASAENRISEIDFLGADGDDREGERLEPAVRDIVEL